MSDSLEKARREAHGSVHEHGTDAWRECPHRNGEGCYNDECCVSHDGHDAIARLAAAAREAGRLEGAWPTCEHTGEKAVQGSCPTHKGDACLVTLSVRMKIAAARLAGRLEQAERTIQIDRDDSLYPGDDFIEALIKERDRLRRKAGK